MFCFSFFFWFDLFRNSQFVFNKAFNKIVMYFTNMKTKSFLKRWRPADGR